MGTSIERPSRVVEPGALTAHRWRVLFVLCVAVFTINVDTTLVNVALPTRVRELRASTSDLQWVVDGYNLAFAALVLAAGSLSDRFGRKGALVTGLVIFGIATAAGALATSTGELIMARVVMGIGAAIVFPNTLSILSNVFTDRTERAKAIGIWGATTGMGVCRERDRSTDPASASISETTRPSTSATGGVYVGTRRRSAPNAFPHRRPPSPCESNQRARNACSTPPPPTTRRWPAWPPPRQTSPPRSSSTRGPARQATAKSGPHRPTRRR
jgi:hypothetical protein